MKNVSPTPDEITGEAVEPYDELDEATDEFVAEAARRVLERTEW